LWRAPLAFVFALVPAVATAQTFASPCAADSYWKRKISAQATRLPLKDQDVWNREGTQTLNDAAGSWGARWVYLHQQAQNDVPTQLLQRTQPTTGKAICDPTRVYSSAGWSAADVWSPPSLDIEDYNGDNPWVFVDSDGDVREFLFCERCSKATSAANSTKPACRFGGMGEPGTELGNPYPLSGPCLPFRGEALGTYLPLLPGLIRVGELESPVGTDIAHTLAIALPAKIAHPRGPSTGESDGSTTQGWRWPAKTRDGCSYPCSGVPSTYTGVVQELETGALFSLPADTNCESLTRTEPGRKLCAAALTYGWQMVDVSGNTQDTNNWQIQLEDGTGAQWDRNGATTHAITLALRERYQIDLVGANFKANCDNVEAAPPATVEKTEAWCRDLKDLLGSLVVITTNTEATPKGGVAEPVEPEVPTLVVTDVGVTSVEQTTASVQARLSAPGGCVVEYESAPAAEPFDAAVACRTVGEISSCDLGRLLPRQAYAYRWKCSVAGGPDVVSATATFTTEAIPLAIGESDARDF